MKLSLLSRYRKNLELLARDNPLNAYQLDTVDSKLVKFCKTYQNEENLKEKNGKICVYMHAQEGAEWEAKCWAKTLPLENHDIIFVFGIGLGYYYLPLKTWLKEDPKRHIIFLDDNLPVIHFFLQTKLATEILENPQVIVKILPKIKAEEDGWALLRRHAASLLWTFALSRTHFSALMSYFVHRFDFFNAFSMQWFAALSRAKRSLIEFYPSPSFLFHNFYANLFYLGEAFPGYKLANAMQSIPAVLCGAGPSLSKQLPLLKTLSERVFLMASGSAMNALTQASIVPHIGGALDPTPAQASRLLTNFGFNVPAFYQNRFFDQALTQWHGWLLYMPSSGAYRISEWFEEELGIEGAKKVVMGVSTSNFLLEIANFLGCRPIVLVGMDLAYTGDKRYLDTMLVHPAENKADGQANKKKEPLIAVPGVAGKDVYVTTQWFYEAVFISAFKQRHPETLCLNATEGGVEIPHLIHASFSNVIEEYFLETWDILGWFHGVVQNVAAEKVETKNVHETLFKWKTSLETCKKLISRLAEYLQGELELRSPLASDIRFDFYRGEAALWQEELFQEPAYVYFLESINTVFETLHYLRFRKLKWVSSENEITKEKLSIEKDRLQFLDTYVNDHLTSFNEGMEAFNKRKAALSIKHDQAEKLKKLIPPLAARSLLDARSIGQRELAETVEIIKNFEPHLIPRDSWPKPGKASGIEALIGKMNGKREGQTLYFYPNGNVKAEAFYLGGMLHGPWSFYSIEGTLLFQSLFVEGKREGKCYAYYSDGALYSLLEYSCGLAEGMHCYYYPDGTLKTIEHFEKGKHEGILQLYYSNGLLKKEQHFSKGQLHGRELAWNEWGILTLEATYEYGKIHSISKKWEPPYNTGKP